MCVCVGGGGVIGPQLALLIIEGDDRGTQALAMWSLGVRFPVGAGLTKGQSIAKMISMSPYIEPFRGY